MCSTRETSLDGRGTAQPERSGLSNSQSYYYLDERIESHVMTRHQRPPHPQTLRSRGRGGRSIRGRGRGHGSRGSIIGGGGGGGGSRKVRRGGSGMRVGARAGVRMGMMMASIGSRAGHPRRRRRGSSSDGILLDGDRHVLDHRNHAATTATTRCTATRRRRVRRS